MSKIRSVGIAAVFLAGCAVGGASSRLVAVPEANADENPSVSRWDYKCIEGNAAGYVEQQAKALGAQGWEMAGVESDSRKSVWCFRHQL